MKAVLNWTGQIQFDGTVGDHTVKLDSKPPVGRDEGFTPKELVALGIGGCTAMDVVALLRKHKQQVESFSVEVDTNQTNQHPVVFSDVHLIFRVNGPVDENVLKESVELSQTKYCGVSAMIAKTAEIQFRVVLNEKQICTGRANFNSNPTN